MLTNKKIQVNFKLGDKSKRNITLKHNGPYCVLLNNKRKSN